MSFDLTAGEADALDRLVDTGLFGTSRIAAARRLLDSALVEALMANGIANGARPRA